MLFLVMVKLGRKEMGIIGIEEKSEPMLLACYLQNWDVFWLNGTNSMVT